jgi:hypothetical protein
MSRKAYFREFSLIDLRQDAAISALQSRLATDQGSINTLLGDVQTLKGDISTKLGLLNSDLQTDIVTAKNEISTTVQDINTYISDSSDIANTRITAFENESLSAFTPLTTAIAHNKVALELIVGLTGGVILEAAPNKNYIYTGSNLFANTTLIDADPSLTVVVKEGVYYILNGSTKARAGSNIADEANSIEYAAYPAYNNIGVAASSKATSLKINVQNTLQYFLLKELDLA